MRTRFSRFLGFTFASFGIISAFFQTFALPSPFMRYLIFGTTILCALVSLFFFRRSRHYEQAISALSKLIKVKGPYTVRPVISEAELKEVWRIDLQNFEDHGVPIDAGVSWWRKYPKGVYVLIKDSNIIGYISFWPLTRRSFEDFKCGKRLENKITSRCIAPPQKNTTGTYWYIGSIALLSHFRRTGAVRTLLHESIIQWLNDLKPDGELNLCALGYSPEGESLLRRFGFHKFADATETLHRLPVYMHKSCPSELTSDVERMLPEKIKPTTISKKT